MKFQLPDNPPPNWFYSILQYALGTGATLILIDCILRILILIFGKLEAHMLKVYIAIILTNIFFFLALVLLASRFKAVNKLVSWSWDTFEEASPALKANMTTLCWTISILNVAAAAIAVSCYNTVHKNHELFLKKKEKLVKHAKFKEERTKELYKQWFSMENNGYCDLTLTIVEYGTPNKDAMYHAVKNYRITDADRDLGNEDISCAELIIKVRHDYQDFLFMYKAFHMHPLFETIKNGIQTHSGVSFSVYSTNLEPYIEVPNYINVLAYKTALIVSIIKQEQIDPVMMRLVDFVKTQYEETLDVVLADVNAQIPPLAEQEEEIEIYAFITTCFLVAWFQIFLVVPLAYYGIYRYERYMDNQRTKQEAKKVQAKKDAKNLKKREESVKKEQQRLHNKQLSQTKKDEEQRLKLQKEETEKARRAQICKCIENAFKDSSVIDQLLSGVNHWPDNRKKEFYQNLKQSFALPMTADEQAAYEENLFMWRAMVRQEDSILKKLNIYSIVNPLRNLIATEIRDTNVKIELQHKLDKFEKRLKKENL